MTKTYTIETDSSSYGPRMRYQTDLNVWEYISGKRQQKPIFTTSFDPLVNHPWLIGLQLKQFGESIMEAYKVE